MRTIKISVFLVLLVLSISSCKNTNKDSDGNNVKISKEDIKNSFDQAENILYSLPSPIETALILESAGVEFNSDILNPVSKLNDYLTNKKMALNLGIYSADLSYASLFDQKQITINYMGASKKLADQLGILEAINEETIQELEDNISDKNEILNIISETFMNSSSYLEENNRGEISALIILGGWIEGLYLSIQLVDDNIIQNEELVQIIIDQQISLEDMIGLLNYYEDYKEIRLLSTELTELKLIFEKIKGPQDTRNFPLLSQKVNDIRAGYVQ